MSVACRWRTSVLLEAGPLRLAAMAARYAGGSARFEVAGEDGGAQRCGRCAEGRQDRRGHRVLHGEEGEDEVLDADVGVVQRLRLVQREHQALLGARREWDMAAGSRARKKRGVAVRACGQGGVATRAAATPPGP